jgi:hypothetical protein
LTSPAPAIRGDRVQTKKAGELAGFSWLIRIYRRARLAFRTALRTVLRTLRPTLRATFFRARVRAPFRAAALRAALLAGMLSLHDEVEVFAWPIGFGDCCIAS